ncbi:unnamed protein product [Rhizoctonia solani]|uniref:Protein kinase domain-containing protein n=1 Tax=Rhizoctonia solani TaxID=456999 RepID=A0A8H3DVC8_9AGAM|nr:unnamed protein product [Rhizoctonia solani]
MSLLIPSTLRATTPANINRFNTTKLDEVRIGSIGCSDPMGVIAHPEGPILSYRGCIVSTQDVTDTHVATARLIVKNWENLVEATVFLEVLGRQINYYVVDHKTKRILWIAGQDPESFNGATRARHEQEYWIHMENFPGPRFSTPEDLRLLKRALVSNPIDVLTSEGSASPLDSLEMFSNTGDAHQTYAVAWLWNLILQSSVVSARSVNNTTSSDVCTYPVMYRVGGIVCYYQCGKYPAMDTEHRPALCSTHLCNKMYDPSNIGDVYHHAYQAAMNGNQSPADTALETLKKQGFKDISHYLDFPHPNSSPTTAGGSGEIYLVRVVNTPFRATIKTLAIKIPRWKNRMTENQKATLVMHDMHESLIWSMCKHPNIHEFLGGVEYRGRFGMASQWMTYGDLFHVLRRAPPQYDFRSMCLQICVGVAYLHDLGIAHGDLKSQNILLSPDLTPQITDFGSARLKGGLLDSLILGRTQSISFRWAPREMLPDDAIPTTQADIHSLGMLLDSI